MKIRLLCCLFLAVWFGLFSLYLSLLALHTLELWVWARQTFKKKNNQKKADRQTIGSIEVTTNEIGNNIICHFRAIVLQSLLPDSNLSQNVAMPFSYSNYANNAHTERQRLNKVISAFNCGNGRGALEHCSSGQQQQLTPLLLRMQFPF